MRTRNPLKRPPIASFRYECEECGRPDTWAEARRRWLEWQPPIHGPKTEMEAMDADFMDAIMESYLRTFRSQLMDELGPNVVTFPLAQKEASLPSHEG